MIGGAFMGCMLAAQGGKYRRVSSIFQDGSYTAANQAPLTFITMGVPIENTTCVKCEAEFMPMVGTPSFESSYGFGILMSVSTLGIRQNSMHVWTTSSQSVATDSSTLKMCHFVSEITTDWSSLDRRVVFRLGIAGSQKEFVIDRTYKTTHKSDNSSISIFAASLDGVTIVSSLQACKPRSVKIFSVKLFNDSVKYIDLVPVVRIEDNVAGFLNTVDGKFYGPTNGKGSYGYDE